MRRSILALCAFGLLLGCQLRREPATADQLRARAAFELGCPPEYLALIRIDEPTGGVTGCGRRVLYVETCDRSGRCRWTYDREAGAPAFAGVQAPHPGAYGRPSPYAASVPSPYVDDEEWRERVPNLLRDEPGF